MPCRKRFGTVVSGIVLLLGLQATLHAQHPVVSLEERTRGAERIIVGRVASVAPNWQVNEFGDRLIVSTVRVSVEETLKGQVESVVAVEIEGGTIGDLTLQV